MLISRSLLLVTIIVFVLYNEADCCRRRRRCSSRNCSWSSWGGWSSCSATCGSSGTKRRSRYITSYAYCGGSCYGSSSDSDSCPGTCCPVDCSYSWTYWSSCSVTCQYGTRSRRTWLYRYASCGGRSCPSSPQTQRCGNGRCCPVNCAVGSWGSWGSCNAACERSGQRRRTRPIARHASCGGTSCPSTVQTKVCSGPCCPRDCVLTSWSAWSKCSSRSCATNSGTQTRSRRRVTASSCGGSCPISSSSQTQTQRCTPTPIRCVVSAWAGWQSCVPTNGKCGSGTQKRVRRIIVQNYCSPGCPATQETRGCMHSCCPVPCQVNNWQAWTACSSTCGRGTTTRKRTVRRPASCGGQGCPSLTQSTNCEKYNNADCIMGAWSTWSVCDNGCGQGRARKTRTIVKREVCRGRKCGAVEGFKVCTDYRNNRDCEVSQWTSWGKCDQTCTVGRKPRTRKITVTQQCRGNKCPAIKESAQCGSPNNGCQHKCTNGTCSCNLGYNLIRNKQCVAKDCGTLKLAYCAPGTELGITCKHATVSCPNNKTSFPVTCSVVCPSTYAVKGINSVKCTAAGTWSSSAATYCRRINDPPTQIILSGSHIIHENPPRNTLVGVLSSVDPNGLDSHSYTLISGSEGKFVIIGDKLRTTCGSDYETMTKRYDLTIRSTDNGNPPFYVDKVITISVSDVNERPKSIQLSNRQIQENCDIDTVVGVLSTSDGDTNQQFTYALKDSASGRFKIDGNTVKVAVSNKKCLENGGHFCTLNYETTPQFPIIVRSTDSGSPALFIDTTLNISLTDVNDQPRGLGLSNNMLLENATKGHVIGRFSAQDEDHGQVLKYFLSNDDQGRFAVNTNGVLYKVNGTDYEKNKTHSITAVVKDNGIPSKKMERNFVIEVLDVNEPPISIRLNNTQILENANYGTIVGTLEVHDNDTSQNLTFALDSNPSGLFSLSGATCAHGKQTVCTAQLSVSGDIDYEKTQMLGIAVRVSDQHASFKVQNFYIFVQDVNERPTKVIISGDLEASVLENSPGAFIGELVTSDEDDGQSHSYTLVNGSAFFIIRRNQLFLKGKKLDYETKDTYAVIVTSTDNGTLPLTSPPQALLIHVLDQNESPTAITLSNSDVQENKAAGTIIGNLTVDDPDNSGNYPSRQAHTCRLSNSDQGKFRIVTRNGRNTLIQAVPSFDYEKSVLHNISIVCTDPHGLSVEKSFVVTVIDVNEEPNKVILSKTTILENLGSVTIGQLTTQDPDNFRDNKQSFQYSILRTGSDPFTIDGDILKTTRSLNYEATSSWTIVVRAQDNGSPVLYRVETIMLSVVDKNDRPTAIQLSNFQVKENSNRGTLVGDLATTDEDVGQKHKYTITDGASGRFKVNGNSVLVAADNTNCLRYGGIYCVLNFENQASYNITIRTSDNGSPRTMFDQTFEIFLVDDNDKPRDLRLSNDRVNENASIGDVIGLFSARDEDVRQALKFLLVDDDDGRFAVNNKGELITAKRLTNETAKSHVIRVKVVDNGYHAKQLEKNFTIEILHINEAPVALSFVGVQTPNVPENTTTGSIIGTLLAQDSDPGQILQFQLDDDSNGEFSLKKSTYQCQSATNNSIKTSCKIKLILAKRLNYEVANSRYILVRVTDNHGLFKAQRVSINITDCNDAPTNITLNSGVSALVDENASGAFVGRLETSDEDGSQNWRYELVDDAGAMFRIVGSKMFVSSGRSLNFEQQFIYRVTVKSTDNGSPSYDVTRNFTIIVSDINERATDIMLSGYDIKENSLRGTIIANISVEDADNIRSLRQQHTCFAIGQNSDKLGVNSQNLVNTIELDYERTPSINITIECIDDGSPPLSYRKDFAVIVQDENEAPLNITLSSSKVCENLQPGVIATLSTLDPDNAPDLKRQTFFYQIYPSKGLPFFIDGDALNTTERLDYEKLPSWRITIQSTDNGKPPLSVNQSFMIHVDDVNEAPTDIILSPNMVDENPGENTLVGTLATVDEDRGQRHRYILLDGAAGKFKLVNNSEIRIAISNTDCLLHGGSHCSLNYETQQVHVIRVRSMDDGSPPQQHDMDLNITLRDTNDKPRNLVLSKYWVKENATLNTTVGYFTADDEDSLQTLNYSLVKNKHGLFGVTKDGRLYVSKPVNHENSSSALITVNVKDNGTPTKWMEQQFTIIIQNVNEAPVSTSFKSTGGQQPFTDNYPTVEENSPVGTVVGTLVSLDQDAGQTLRFTLDDSSGGRFAVNTSSRCHNETNIQDIKTSCSCALHVNGLLDYEDIPQHDIIVRVTDTFGHFHVSNFTITLLDRNDRPSNVTLQGSFTGRVKENRNDEMIGELVTSDQDSSQSHTYALLNSSNSRFTLKGNKLYTTQSSNLNYEQQQQYGIVVESTDDGKPPKSVEERLIIQVEDINESPRNITLSGFTIEENSPQGTFIANITVSDPDNLGPNGVWQTHTCQLLDSAQGRFVINSTTNTLLVSTGELNFEKDNNHDIVMQCTDSGSKPLNVRQSFTIDVLDVNERPIQITLSNQEIPENSEPLNVGDLSSTDPDNELVKRQTFTYSLVSQNEEYTFFISGNQLKTNRSLDYEKKNFWELMIQTRDSGGLTLTQNFTITVQDRNDPPTDILAIQQLILLENSAVGTPIGVFSAVDEDAGQAHRFFINYVTTLGYGYKNSVHYSTFFSLDSSSGRLLVTSLVDYENVTQFTLEVMTQDNGYPQYSYNKTFAVKVRDVNERPSMILLDNTQVVENSAAEIVVGNLSVVDPDNLHEKHQHYDCKVVNNVPFKVLDLKLVVADAVLNFESQDNYHVEVNCSQKGNITFQISTTFIINITDINEQPYNLNITETFVEENREAKTFVASISAEDPDFKDTVVFNFGETTEDSRKFSINGSRLLTSVIFNYEKKSSYAITLMAKDDGTPSLNTTRGFNITIRDMNDQPEGIDFSSSGVNEVASVGTIVGNFSTVDQDKDQTHSYELLSNLDLFSINGNQLVLNQSGVLDFETSPVINISVRTTDNGYPPKSYEELIQVTILDGNDKPYNISYNSLSVNENTKGRTGIAFDVHDDDANQSHSCTLVKGMEFFEVSEGSKNASLFVKNGAVLDYEDNESIEISLSCSDNGTPPLSCNKTFTINVADVNERPVSVYLNGSMNLNENVAAGFSLGNLLCQDPDRNQSHSFQVLGEFSKTFNVNQSTTILTVVSNRMLDYEKLDSPNISVEINATDDGDPPLSLITNLTLTINEVNEGANRIELSPGNVTLIETKLSGTNISELVCNNPERWQTMEYTLLSHQNVFMVRTSSFNVTYEPAILNQRGIKQKTFEQSRTFLFLRSNLSYDTSSSYEILVNVIDNGLPPLSFNDTVEVKVAKVDPCLPQNDCSINADCSRVDGFRYNCSCKNGFTGNGYNCTEIDDCVPSTSYCEIKTSETCPPCRNNANCSDAHLTFNCTCLPGFNGTRCEHNIDECKLPHLPHCLHGDCIDGINTFNCTCYRGYTSRLCNKTIVYCDPNPCGEYGRCENDIGEYSCNCIEGFSGTRCNRNATLCNATCLPNQFCIPKLLNNTIVRETYEEQKEEEPEKQEAENICFSLEDMISIYLLKNLSTTLAEGNSSLTAKYDPLRIALEDWFLKFIKVLHVYTPSYTEDSYSNLSDVAVVSITENHENISVHLVARIGKETLSQRGFFCSLYYLLSKSGIIAKRCPRTENYQFAPLNSNGFMYTDYLICPTASEKEHYECVDSEALGGGSAHALSKWAIYTPTVVGALLLIVIGVIVFAVRTNRSHVFNLQEAMHRHGEDDEHYRDVMLRHHISSMSNTGAVDDSIYGLVDDSIHGLDEDDGDGQMIQNPLYGTARDVSPPTDNRAFANPLYDSAERERGFHADTVTGDELSN